MNSESTSQEKKSDKENTKAESDTDLSTNDSECNSDAYDDDDVLYSGKRDSKGKPNGRGTLTWNESGTRFEGRFCHGMKDGKGSFYFPDESILSGNFSSDELNGLGVYTYSDGSRMEAYYTNGELNGPFVEYNTEGRITIKGHHRNNKRVGFLQIFDNYGGILMGTVDSDGHLTGDNIAYVYPDQYCALVGHFVDGEMRRASPAKLVTKLDNEVKPQFELEHNYGYTLSLDESTSTCISTNPQAVDMYEQTYVYVAFTTEDKGDGLFAKVDLDHDQVVSFYNGIRITHEEVDARSWSANANTISLDDNTVLDVPSSLLHSYGASLGHKANHSCTPNCRYDEFQHPRFGFIKCIRTLGPISRGTELTCDYEYSHKVPGTQEDDLPWWFVNDTKSFSKNNCQFKIKNYNKITQICTST